jgi:hypothetical protein
LVSVMLSDAEVLEITVMAQLSTSIRVGGNSTVAKVEFGDQVYAVKDYSARTDGRQRLKQEFSALEVLHPELPERFAEPLGIGSDEVSAVHSWIEGVQPSLNEETVSHMLDIGNELHHLSKRVQLGQVNPATDQVLNSNDIRNQLMSRFKLLAATPGPISDFVKSQIEPLIPELCNDHREVGKATPTLSPSDFGAHNLLWDEQSRQMRCIDLEFFGWDDAHKLTCDSLLHPLAYWTDDCARDFLMGSVETYQLNEDRLQWLWPLLNLKWTAITLSRAERNILDGNETKAKEAMQRAEIYLLRAKRVPHSLSDIVKQVASKVGSS